MFQCLGLGTVEEGGCGEDWWHPGCVVGLGAKWYEKDKNASPEHKVVTPAAEGLLQSITDVAASVVGTSDAKEPETTEQQDTEVAGNADADADADADPPLPPGFPQEDDFEAFICYKCVDANPWIKRYAGTSGFLAPVFRRSAAPSPETDLGRASTAAQCHGPEDDTIPGVESIKRKADDDASDAPSKRQKEEDDLDAKAIDTSVTGTLEKALDHRDKLECKYNPLPPAPTGSLSLFLKSDFRDHLCHCSKCFPLISHHPQLLEEEDAYEPPVSEGGDDDGGSTVGSGSLLDRGERALTSVDRVRAIEGVMAYNHLKEKLQPFFKEFAESGKAISAEDIKAHFAKLRGDEDAIRQAGEGATKHGDNREEQSGY
jgi:E3 ubiquitin-protein ligase UBR7